MSTTGQHGIIIPDPSTATADINTVRDLAIQTEAGLSDVKAEASTVVLGQVYTRTQVDTLVASHSGTSATQVREAVTSSTALPTTGNEVGDVRLTEDTDHLWLWDGTAWVDGGPVGIPGQDGSDATVTDATVAAAISDDTRTVIEGWGIIGGGTIDTAPAGSVFRVTSTTRPSTRTDIGVEFVTNTDPNIDSTTYPLDTWLRPDGL